VISRVLRIGALTLGAAALLAVIVWALTSYLPMHRQPTSAPPAAPAPPASLSARDLVGAAATALEGCSLPTAPSVPDSTRASLDEMKAARTAFAAYDAATTAYTDCVDAAVARTAKQYAGVASEADLQALNEFGTKAHNAAFDQEKSLVDQFNAQLRDYIAKHPNQ